MRYSEIITEARVELNGNLVSILKNPAALSLLFFIGNTRKGIARLMLLGDDLLCWDAFLANHDHVEALYDQKATGKYSMAERGEEFAIACEPGSSFTDNANLERILRNPAVFIVHADGREERLAA